MIEKKILAILLICLFLMPSVIYANGDECDPCAGTTGFCIPNPLKVCTLEDFIDSIISFLLALSIAIVPFIAVIGAFYILTSAGDSKQYNKGKDIIFWAAIGLAVMLFSKAIISIVKFLLQGFG